MRIALAAGLLAALACTALDQPSALAADVAVGDLRIEHPWTRATPGGAQVAGGYLTIVNKGTTADHLTGGSLDGAATFGLHSMSMSGGVMEMRPIGPLEIPAGGSLTLDPSAKHIMFGGLKHGLKKGDVVAGTLTFQRTGTIAVRFTVESIGARSPGKDPSNNAGQAMPGMNMD